jgi:hypothetical protein
MWASNPVRILSGIIKVMKKKIVVVAVILAVLGIIVGYIAWSGRNTTEAEVKSVLKDLVSSKSVNWYCENGASVGFDNQTAWWEEIYVSNGEVVTMKNDLQSSLKNKGYSLDSSYVDNIEDKYSRGKPYWEVRGERNDYSVVARFSVKSLTQNHCFKGFTHMDEKINPEEYNSVMVIHFKHKV